MHRTQLNYPVRCLFYTFQQRHVCLPGNFTCTRLCPSINHLGVTDEMRVRPMANTFTPQESANLYQDSPCMGNTSGLLPSTRKCKSVHVYTRILLEGFQIGNAPGFSLHGKYFYTTSKCKSVHVYTYQDSPFACTTPLIALSAGCPTDY